jgi:endonuclease I
MAQPLTADVAELVFSATDETQTDSLPISLTNPHEDSVRITGVRLYDTYGQEAFATSLDATTLAPGQSQSAQVYFSPRHNILHHSELLILTESPYGALRIDLQGQGVYSNSYYQSTRNLSEQSLKEALHTRLGQGYQGLSYSAARDEMFMQIDNQRVNGQGASVNTLEGVYTGFTLTSYSNRSNAQNQGINTEHTWPQSLFNQDLPMRSDLFHLFPTQQNANGQRANFPFGTVSNPTWQQGGSKLGGGVFEPRDQQKGPTARAMMYFVLRYQNYSNYLNGQEAILRQWHTQYPPDQVEQVRNQAIFQLQNNRNPFIDYPQLIERITSLSSQSSATPTRSFDASHSTIDLDTVRVGDTLVFTYVLVNTGNQPLTLSSESLSDAQLTLDPDQTISGSIAPGDAAVLAIRLIADQVGTLGAGLSFSLNVPDQEAVSVPIQAEVVMGSTDLRDEPQGQAWQVVPNPVRSTLWLTRAAAGPASNGRLLDLQGRQLRRWKVPAGAVAYPVSVEGLAPGLYLLRQGGEEVKIRVW